MEIYIQRNGQVEGPLSQSEYREKFRMGVLNEGDLVSMDRKSWYPLSQLIEPPAIAARRWMREFKCKKCGAPFKTLTLGKSKVTASCGKCNSKHNRLITVCFAILLVAAFIAEKILDREHEDDMKKAKAYISSLRNPKSHATRDDNTFLFPPSTAGSGMSSDGKLELRGAGVVSAPTMAPTIPLFSSADTTPTKETAVLRSSKDAFMTRYGEPSAVMHRGLVETDTFVYEDGDWIVRVGFWKGLAQHIAVAKIDRTPMTEADAQVVLSRVAGHQRWSRAKDEDGENINGWGSSDATALLETYHYKGTDGNESQSTLLRIMTNDFFREYDKSISSK